MPVFKDINDIYDMISSEEFSKRCDFVICPRYVKDPIIPINTPKCVFITGENGIFETCIHILKNFKDKYDLVYHCTDRTFDRFDFECIRPYVNHIWAQNCEITHPMITKIPLGFSDSYPLTVSKRSNTKKDILCYLNVGLPNTHEHKFIRYHSLRSDCINHFKSKTWCTIESNIEQEDFNNKLQRSKFVICPMGFGLDTHRFFETAWLKCTPIVISSGLDSLYKQYNALIVDSWDDVTEELLNNHEHKTAPDEVFNVSYFIK